jgi:hypothetical protein
MEKSLFDQIIKKKLEQVETPAIGAKASWQAFAQKLDAVEFRADADTTSIDQLAKEHLAKPKEVPYVPNNWNALSARMDRTKTLVQRLRSAKIAEAAILILTLLNLDAFQVKQTKWLHPKLKSNEPIVEVQTPSVSGSTTGLGEMVEAKLTTTYSSEGQVGSKTPEGNHLNQINDQNAGSYQQYIVNQQVTDFLAQENKTSQSSNPLVFDQNLPTTTDHVSNIIADLQTPASKIVSGSSTIIRSSSGIKTEMIEPLSASEIVEVASMEDGVQWLMPATQPFIARSIKRALSVYAGPDFVSLGGVNPTRTVVHTVGVQYSHRKGNWGVATGVEYSNLSYKSKEKKDTLAGSAQAGFVGRALQNLQFDIVQIPVRATRSIFRKRKTEVLATGGVQLMATVQISPDYNSFYAPGSTPDPTSQQIPPIPPVKSVDGLFEGGRLSDNTHLLAVAGLRLEQHLNASNKLLFVEVNGQKLLTKRVASTDATFAAIGLRAGLMATL